VELNDVSGDIFSQNDIGPPPPGNPQNQFFLTVTLKDR